VIRRGPTIYDWVMLLLLLVTIASLALYGSEIIDLRCRIARMETLAVSAEPLPDCEAIPARTPRRAKEG